MHGDKERFRDREFFNIMLQLAPQRRTCYEGDNRYGNDSLIERSSFVVKPQLIVAGPYCTKRIKLERQDDIPSLTTLSKKKNVEKRLSILQIQSFGNLIFLATTIYDEQRCNQRRDVQWFLQCNHVENNMIPQQSHAALTFCLQASYHEEFSKPKRI